MKTDALVEGPYRYWLSRSWGEGSRVLWVMLNPSTADHAKDDPTIRKCTGFTKRLGFSGFFVVNLFAWRSTVPGVLAVEDAKGTNINGPKNDATIQGLAAQAGMTICAWGAFDKLNLAPRIAQVSSLLHAENSSPAVALGYSMAGQPRHPLMMPYYAVGELQAWPRRSA